MQSLGRLAALFVVFPAWLPVNVFSQTANNPLVGHPSCQQACNLPHAAATSGITGKPVVVNRKS